MFAVSIVLYYKSNYNPIIFMKLKYLTIITHTHTKHTHTRETQRKNFFVVNLKIIPKS